MWAGRLVGLGNADEPAWRRAVLKTWMIASASLLSAACLSGCSLRGSNACYGLSDSEALRNVIRDYQTMSIRDARKQHMQLSNDRLIGVGRTKYPKGSDNLIQLWFLQDDGTVTVASYYEDCDLKFSPGAPRSDMNRAAYTVQPPQL